MIFIAHLAAGLFQVATCDALEVSKAQEVANEQVADSQKQALRKRITRGLTEICEIDTELTAMQNSSEQLSRSAVIRAEQIKSLRVRFPAIMIQDGASADAIYRALYAVRTAAVAQVRPLTQASLAMAHEQGCAARARLSEMRSEFERTDDFLKMTLSERLAWRNDFDSLMKVGPKDPPCT
jgi:hypothetical protein